MATKKTPTKAKGNDIFKFFLEHNKAQSAKFVDSDQTLLRRKYRKQFPVEIAAMKCMDGRINMSIMTDVPVGIIQPYRNLGGKFDLGGHFGELLSEWVSRAVNQGKDAIVFVTYHWSKGTKHCGCKGFAYDVDAAREYTEKNVKEVEDVFGKRHVVVYPIQLGIETDEDSMVLHGANGKKLDMSEVATDDSETLRISLEKLFPDMNAVMMRSLVNVCVGNIRHIAQIRAAKRQPIDLDHKENILAIGRGFDWFHLPNRMLIVGPYSFDLATPIAVAGKIILDNIKSGRIPKKDGFALITSAVYRDEAGPERQRAEKKAQSLMRFAVETLKKEVPELMPYMQTGAGVLNEHTRFFTKVEIEK